MDWVCELWTLINSNKFHTLCYYYYFYFLFCFPSLQLESKNEKATEKKAGK